ncbi:putative calpain [Cercophora samala]|uniref:Calpain n=1 Tax=Cercophora samala TaxID=330535 RepID=A0AA39ZNE5_9PEZI|nr:putative calpain [Cercophora samala]
MSVPPPPVPPPTSKKNYTKAPQELIHEFWDRYFTKKPGKVTRIFPRSLYSSILPLSLEDGQPARSARNAAESYEAAAKECREKVQRIIKECHRTNEKFTDPDFDIEWDLEDNCLNGLIRWEWDDEDDDTGNPVSADSFKRSLDTLAESNALGANGTVALDPGVVRGYIADDPWAALFGGAFATKGQAITKGASPQTQQAVAAAAAQKGVLPHGRNAPRHHTDPRNNSKSTKKGGVQCGEWYNPGSKHRLDWIFSSPQWTIDGYSSSDIKQGSNGDCWWLAAVATITHRKDLMEKVCVIRDEEVGVYGFVFYRDGEWISTVVDDNLYLKYPDFDYYGDRYDSTGKLAREYRKRYQTGSEALYFAQCEDQNETWLPILEKAYAKVHGDYEAISGGWSGEAVEDMTGGVTTTVAANRVLKKDKLWKELVNADGEFVFALSAIGTGWDSYKGGLALGHAYSILKATEEVDEEGKKVRLVKIRNPWGQRSSDGVGEWNGPWSDGSKEWTPYWFKKLNHTFGDDGVFWMSYADMLETFLFIHRTRLFDERWTVVQQWTSVSVGWVAGYLNQKFVIDVKKAGTVVVVLSQLDERYFQGFEGQYDFSLHFLLKKEGGKDEEHICRVRPVHQWENRSVSCEVDLEPGRYEVLPKVTAERYEWRHQVEDVVKKWADKNPSKLRQVGMQYDLAHAKGGIPDEDDLLLKKKDDAKKKAEAKKLREKEKAKRKKEKERAKKRKEKEKRKKAAAAEVTVKVPEGGETTVNVKSSVEKTDKDKKEEEDDKFEDAVEKKEEDVAGGGGGGGGGKVEEKKPETAAPKTSVSTGSSSSSTPAPPKEGQKEEKKDDDVAKKEDTLAIRPAPGTTTTAAAATEEKEVKPDDKKPEQEEKKKEEEGEEESDSDYESETDEEEEKEKEEEEKRQKEEEEARKLAEDEESPSIPWNAVAVLGLRVYAQDSGVSVHLAKPKNDEEGASLVIDSQAVGATM